MKANKVTVTCLRSASEQKILESRTGRPPPQERRPARREEERLQVRVPIARSKLGVVVKHAILFPSTAAPPLSNSLSMSSHSSLVHASDVVKVPMVPVHNLLPALKSSDHSILPCDPHWPLRYIIQPHNPVSPLLNSWLLFRVCD